MPWTLQFTIDLLGPLALLVGLSYAYGFGMRTLPRIGSDLLGLIFGCVAALQMHLPFEPVPGLIIDMRNIPVALAGAFLGTRGLVYCLLVACAMRLQIGGVGAGAGVTAILLAGAAGVAWASITARLLGTGRRSVPVLLALGALVSGHLAASLLLPADLAIWFLTDVAPTIILLNLSALPLAAWLLDREGARQRQIQLDLDHFLEEESQDPLPQAGDLARDLTLCAVSGPASGGAYGFAFKPQGLWFGLPGLRKLPLVVQRQIHSRILLALPSDAKAGVIAGGTLVAVVPAMSEEGAAALSAQIARIVQGEAGQARAVRLRTVTHRFDALPSVPELLVALGLMSKTAARKVFPDGWTPTAEMPVAVTDRLFDISDRIMRSTSLDDQRRV